VNYNFIPLESALTANSYANLRKTLEKVSVIDEALANRGWICGGFARHLMLNRPVEQYFRPVCQIDEYVPRGDIDVFFNSTEDAAASIPKSARPSQAGFAKELHDSVKVQFVDDPNLIRPTIEETLSSFDIVNCRVAINHQYVVIPQDWFEIESRRQLRIGHNDTPFLGSRILKYLKYRGLESLTDDSYEALTGWLAHAANNFGEGDWTTQHLLGVSHSVKKLRARGLVRKEDLIFFIGKWNDSLEERRYGGSFTYEVDWALNEIEKDTKR